jgi:hypothetical protein
VGQALPPASPVLLIQAKPRHADRSVTAVTTFPSYRWDHGSEMKLRLEGDSLRFRLGRSEVARLRDDRAVEETVSFNTGDSLTYRIQTQPGAELLRAEFSSGLITVSMSTNTAQAWASGDQVGLYAQDGKLSIAVEKDFRCLTRTTPEPDAFPNPAE